MTGRAAGLKTEYQRSFRPELFECSSTTYNSNRAFREALKNRCQGHSQDPFVWRDAEDDGSDGDVTACSAEDQNTSGNGDAGVDRRRPAFVAAHVFKHEMLKRLYEKRQRKRPQKAVQTDLNFDSDTGDIGCQTDHSSECSDDVDGTSVVSAVNGTKIYCISAGK